MLGRCSKSRWTVKDKYVQEEHHQSSFLDHFKNANLLVASCVNTIVTRPVDISMSPVFKIELKSPVLITSSQSSALTFNNH